MEKKRNLVQSTESDDSKVTSHEFELEFLAFFHTHFRVLTLAKCIYRELNSCLKLFVTHKIRCRRFSFGNFKPNGIVLRADLLKLVLDFVFFPLYPKKEVISNEFLLLKLIYYCQ